MNISCGLVLLDETGRLLLAHATGTQHWDLPKGGPDEGESPRDAAVREAREETGVDFGALDLLDLGRQPYRKDKTLHLFAARLRQGEVSPSDCVCTSLFLHKRSGRMLPEVDRFAWVDRARWVEHCRPALMAVLERVLPEVQALPLQRLSATTDASVART